MDEIRFYQMTPKQQDTARARFFDAGNDDGCLYLVGSDGYIFSRNKTRRIIIQEGQTPSVPDLQSDFESRLIAAAPEMYELLRALIVDDPTYGIMVSTDTEVTRRAAELLRRLED